VRIKKNIAGRLLLEFSDQCDISCEWLFYLNTDLHPLGWGKKNKMNYSATSVEEKFNLEQCQSMLLTLILIVYFYYNLNKI